jgi:hypothetical protein
LPFDDELGNVAGPDGNVWFTHTGGVGGRIVL